MNYTQNILPNKILNKNIYLKYIFRYKEDKKVLVLDSDSGFSNINVKKNKKKIGSSFLLNYSNFKHKYDKEMEVQLFMPSIQLKSQFEIVSNLIKELSSSSNCTLQILNPIKGGFSVRNKSVVGFLPQSQFKLIIASIAKKSSLINNVPSKIYLSNLHNLNVLLTPRVFFKVSKMSIIPYYQKNNFVSFFKKRTYRPRAGFVFVCNKPLEEPAKKPANKFLDKTLKESANKLLYKPLKESVKKPSHKNSDGKPSKKSVNKPSYKTLKESVKKPLDKILKEPTKKPANKFLKESVNKPSYKTLKESVKKPLYNPLKKPTKKPLDKTLKESANKLSYKPLKKSANKPSHKNSDGKPSPKKNKS